MNTKKVYESGGVTVHQNKPAKALSVSAPYINSGNEFMELEGGLETVGEFTPGIQHRLKVDSTP